MALPPSSYANPQSSSWMDHQYSSIIHPQLISTSNRQCSSIFLNHLWLLSPLSWGLPFLALGILILIFLHRVTFRSPIHLLPKSRQRNPSTGFQRPLAPDTSKTLQSIRALPPPLPIPTIRRHSYPLTINSNSSSNGDNHSNNVAVLSCSPLPSPSPLASIRDPFATAKRRSGSRRHTDVIRQNTTEDVNGCRRHVMVFQKPG